MRTSESKIRQPDVHVPMPQGAPVFSLKQKARSPEESEGRMRAREPAHSTGGQGSLSFAVVFQVAFLQQISPPGGSRETAGSRVPPGLPLPIPRPGGDGAESLNVNDQNWDSAGSGRQHRTGA